MLKVSLDTGASSFVVEDLHKFLVDENPRDIEVYDLGGVLLWKFHLYSKFLYLKKVPDDTSIFRRLPEGTHLHASTMKFWNLPHEDISHFVLHVRHFKYDHSTVKNRFFEWLKRHNRNAHVYFDEHTHKIPRHLQEQYGCTGLHALYCAPGYAAYPYHVKLPALSPMTSSDFEVESCNYNYILSNS